MPIILVIDDNPAVGTALELLFGLRDWRTVTALSPQEGLRRLASERVDLVVQDMNFTEDTTSGEEGVALFRAIREIHPDLPVILLTAWTHLESAVELVKAGAADYLAKPWDDRKLLATVANLLELAETSGAARRLTRESRRAGDDLRTRYDLRGIVFASGAMARAIAIRSPPGTSPPNREPSSTVISMPPTSTSRGSPRTSTSTPAGPSWVPCSTRWSTWPTPTCGSNSPRC